MRIVVIGGVAAGMSAAAKAARTGTGLQIDVYTDEQDISYSACSHPYYIKGAGKRATISSPARPRRCSSKACVSIRAAGRCPLIPRINACLCKWRTVPNPLQHTTGW